MLNKEQILDAQTKKLDEDTQKAQVAERDAQRQAATTSGRQAVIGAGGAAIDAINQALDDGQTYQELIDAAYKKNPQAVKDASNRAKTTLGKKRDELQKETATLKELGRQRQHTEGEADLAKKEFEGVLNEFQGLPQAVQAAKAKIEELRAKFTEAINSGDGEEADQIAGEIDKEEERLNGDLGGVGAKWDHVAEVWEKLPRDAVNKIREEEQLQKDKTDRLSADITDREQNAAKYIYQELKAANGPKQAR